MRKIVIILLLIIACEDKVEIITPHEGITKTNVATYYVATNGSNGNPGTLASPWLTIQYGVEHISAGDILYVRGGTYTPSPTSGTGDGGTTNCGIYQINRHGTALLPFQVFAYGNEVPIISGVNLSAGSRGGIVLNSCAYWNIRGIRVTNVAQSSASYRAIGIEVFGGNNNIIERCTSYGNGGPGFQLRTPDGHDNHFLNCDSYSNYDPYTGGDDADGFDIGFGASDYRIQLTGCRAWDNSDDGYDMYQYSGNTGIYSLTNCWAWNNGYDNVGASAGDGNGFKLGADAQTYSGTTKRYLYNCIAYGNRTRGFSQESARVKKEFYNCIAYANVSHGFSFGWTGDASGFEVADILRNNISYDNGGDPVENLHGGTFYATRVSERNTWDVNTAVTVTDADFANLTPTQLEGARQSDGSLPLMTFLHLTAGSDLIAKGSITGIYTTDGDDQAWATVPSLGPFEFGSNEPTVNYFRRRLVYRGYNATDLKSRADIPNAEDITRNASSIDCGNITTTKIQTALGLSSHLMSVLCLSANVNKWSGYSPYTRSVSGGLLVHNQPTDYLAGDFAGYNHSASIPHYESTTHDDDVWIIPAETVHFSPTVNIGELKFIGGDITGHSDCVGIAFTVWDGVTLVAEDIIDLATATDIIYPDATLTGGAVDKTYTCKLYLVSSLSAFDYTLGDVVCQITELANYTKAVKILQGTSASLSAPTGWVISGTPLSVNRTLGTVIFQGLHNPSYTGHLTVTAYFTNWLGAKVTDDIVLWTGNYSADYGIVIGNTVVWRVGGVTQPLPVPAYGYTATVFVNPV